MKKMTSKFIFRVVFTLIILSFSAVFVHYFRYRYIPLVTVGTLDDIKINALEVYTNKLTYQTGDTVFVYIKSDKKGIGHVNRIQSDLSDYTYKHFGFKKQPQDINLTQSEKGCLWNISDTLILDHTYKPGYYNLKLTTESDTTVYNFIIENRKPSKVAVLAPISTWVAYNNWGGKSLYNNFVEPKTTYYVSSQRPNPLNDVRVEANSTNYFIDQYNAVLLPDYALEYDVEFLKSVDVIVLNYHAEYFTQKMYDHLQALLEKHHVSLISLGGNQMYWKTKWHNHYSYMECRKDLTSFDGDILDYGGMWRHHLNKAEHNILGVQFTDAGMHSYAPYEVKNADHWIYKNTKVKQGDIFGMKGVDHLPISGDETDKIVSYSDNITLLAKGLNCSKNNPVKGFDDNCMKNNGADFILKTNPNYSVLSTGSIQSGSGLGIDSVFTTMINNFIHHEIK